MVDAVAQKSQFDVQLEKANADAVVMKAAFDKVGLKYCQLGAVAAYANCSTQVLIWPHGLLLPFSLSWMLQSRRHSLMHSWIRPLQTLQR
jgi:hypothetical protein